MTSTKPKPAEPWAMVASHIVINNEHEGIEIRKASADTAGPPVPPVQARPARHCQLRRADVEPTEN